MSMIRMLDGCHSGVDIPATSSGGLKDMVTVGCSWCTVSFLLVKGKEIKL
jgi:hypothetical protein